jgi:xanthine dehydrogenase accessory factor
MQDNMARFTEGAKRVLKLAHEQAERLQHSQIGSQHLLLGLMQEEKGVAGRVLRDLGLHRRPMEGLVERMTPISQRTRTDHLELSSGTRKVMELAVDEARRMGHNFIGTEHLLLGLFRQSEGIVIDVVNRLAVSPASIRREAMKVLQGSPSAADRMITAAMVEVNKPAEKAAPDLELTSKGISMDERVIYQALLDIQEKGLVAALATVIRTQGSMPRHAGSKMLVFLDGRIVGTIGGGAMESRVVKAAQEAMKDGQTRINTYTLNDLKEGDPGVCGGTADIFIEPLTSRATLVVIGCGHVGKALAELGKWAGYRVIVSDDREAFCNPTYIPNMDGYVVAPPPEVAKQIEVGPQTYIACTTRGLPIDLDLIPALLKTNVPYLGIIGSRRRWALTAKELEERGVTTDQLARVRAPIGLELQAETPQEIALSILAEITMLRRGGTGQPMQWLGKPESAT